MINEHGQVIVADPGSDKPLSEYSTLQCVHCGGHFAVQPGSGKTRGFCMRCNGPICSAKCAKCVPFEKWLDYYEKGTDLTQPGVEAPTKIWVPVSVKDLK